MQELCLIPIKIETNFEGKLMRAFKNGMRNLANFHQSAFESLKIGTLMRSFYLKCYDNEVYHDNYSKFEADCLVSSKLTLGS